MSLPQSTCNDFDHAMLSVTLVALLPAPSNHDLVTAKHPSLRCAEHSKWYSSGLLVSSWNANLWHDRFQVQTDLGWKYVVGFEIGLCVEKGLEIVWTSQR